MEKFEFLEIHSQEKKALTKYVVNNLRCVLAKTIYDSYEEIFRLNEKTKKDLDPLYISYGYFLQELLELMPEICFRCQTTPSELFPPWIINSIKKYGLQKSIPDEKKDDIDFPYIEEENITQKQKKEFRKRMRKINYINARNFLMIMHKNLTIALELDEFPNPEQEKGSFFATLYSFSISLFVKQTEEDNDLSKIIPYAAYHIIEKIEREGPPKNFVPRAIATKEELENSYYKSMYLFFASFDTSTTELEKIYRQRKKQR